MTQPPVTITQPPITVTAPAQTVTVATTILGQVTSCPAPTNTAPVPPFDPKSDLTWGCKPGFVCSPSKPNTCNVWADSPDDGFLCNPSDCIQAPSFPLVVWPENTTSYYPPTEGYFNLAPPAFGLSYDIFEEEVVVEEVDGHLTTVTTGNWASQTDLTHYPPPSSASVSTPYAGGEKASRKRAMGKTHLLAKRDTSIIPSVCYDMCNDAYLDAQQTGKTPGLCLKTSSFYFYYDACEQCANDNSDQGKLTTKAYITNKFSQFIDYCNPTPAQSQVSLSGPQSQQSTTPNAATTSQAPPNTSPSTRPISTSSSPSSTAVSSVDAITGPAPSSSAPRTTSSITSPTASHNGTSPTSSIHTAAASRSWPPRLAATILPLLAFLLLLF